MKEEKNGKENQVTNTVPKRENQLVDCFFKKRKSRMTGQKQRGEIVTGKKKAQT